MPDVVVHGRTAYVCDSAEELADAIARTGLIDPYACRAEVEQRFDVGSVAAGYELVYRDVLERAAPASSSDSSGQRIRSLAATAVARRQAAKPFVIALSI